ncbi:hypothetical protein [Curtobacterium sp. UCD-KPL2560]|uniref:hypothetical protein n=1 Tax=Curtobacterium sp. UCD-KPL2560 TaxID=1885315 RepID=UPI0008243211|nr:hypothetical protein [Curtobacterium sp. UCD-KPL2560]
MSAAEARAALEEAHQHQLRGHDYDANQSIAKAQALATIALAEEQRTANLIALFDEEGPEVFRAPEIPATSIGTPVELRQARRAASEAVRTQYLVLAADIAERLDLS